MSLYWWLCAGSSLEAALAKLGLQAAAEQGVLQANLSSDTITQADQDDVGQIKTKFQ